MEYTGLKLQTKPRKKVFEGDILEATARNGAKYYQTVEYLVSDQYCGFVLRQENRVERLTRNILKRGNRVRVGNIYQNPELLK